MADPLEPLAIEDDVILWCTTRFRTWLATRDEPYAQNVTVDSREPSPDDDPPSYPLVIFTDNGGDSDTPWTGQADIGVSVLAGTKQNTKPAMDLARLVRAGAGILPSLDAGNPISAVVSATRPALVPEDAVHGRAYFLLTVAVASRPF